MQQNKKNISRELIIRTTLGLIEEKEGIKGVNLRVIANKINCNHTNLYNYFDSLEEIFWESLGQAILIMIDYVESNISLDTNREDSVYLLMSNILDFSMKYPGWYRLIWLEPLHGEPSVDIINILHIPTQKFNEAIIKTNTTIISQEKASYIGNIIHSYMHGELCKWINKRSFFHNNEETKKMILSNAKHLYQLLLKEDFEI